jgi:Bacteriophage tail sheath protein
MTLAALPGYRVVDAAPSTPEPGLRNDVAAFVGSTERGPLGVPVRVEGRQAYVAAFGGWGTGTVPRAVSAYVANGGLVAWVVRAGHGGAPAPAEAELAGADAPITDGPARCSLPGNTLRCSATSPGTWADGTVVRLTYRAFGLTGAAEFDVAVEVPGWVPWRRSGLAADDLPATVGATGLVSLTFSGPPRPASPGPGNPGPAILTWELVLRGGQEPVLDAAALRQGIAAQAEVDEIALVCIPGVVELLSDDDHDDVTATLAESCADAQDRLAVVSAPVSDAASLTEWRTRLRAIVADPVRQRAVAAYVPWLRSADLTGRGLDRYPPTDPVGHVCGVIARLDRERGSGWSPANALVSDAVDVAAPLPPPTQALALGEGVNLLRGRVGGGLEIWGARTLDPGDGRYVAHRRLVHRIVRAVRRILEPLVFDTNDRLLWFSVTRAVSGVLMEAWRSGSLRGETPDQAYRVRCDETTNPPEAIDDGRVVCQVELAPATPMEFITLRLTLGAEGLLEVVEQ